MGAIFNHNGWLGAIETFLEADNLVTRLSAFNKNVVEIDGI